MHNTVGASLSKHNKHTHSVHPLVWGSLRLIPMSNNMQHDTIVRSAYRYKMFRCAQRTIQVLAYGYFLSQPNSSYLSVTILSEAVIVEIPTAQALRLKTNPRREHEANICHPLRGPTLTQKEVGGCDLVAFALGCRKPLVSIRWAILFFLYTNRLRRLSSCIVEPLAMKAVFSLNRHKTSISRISLGRA